MRNPFLLLLASLSGVGAAFLYYAYTGFASYLVPSSFESASALQETVDTVADSLYEPVEQLTLAHPFDTSLSTGDQAGYVFSGPRYLRDRLRVDVSDSKLNISFDPMCVRLRSQVPGEFRLDLVTTTTEPCVELIVSELPALSVTVPSLRTVRTRSSGDLHIESLRFPDVPPSTTPLRLEVLGSGDITTMPSATLWSPRLTLSSLSSGDIDIQATTIDYLPEVSLQTLGSGDITLRTVQGVETGLATLTALSSGSVDLSTVPARHAAVDLRGSGDISLEATIRVTGRLSGSGDVVLSGTPAVVNIQSSGSGSLVRR